MQASLLLASFQPVTPGGWILCFWIVSTANWNERRALPKYGPNSASTLRSFGRLAATPAG